MQRQAFIVNDVLVDPVRCQLQRKGEQSEEIPLRALQILQYLVLKEGELVSYQELEEQVWKSPTSESAVYQQVTHLRKALGDNPNKPTFIRTVPRAGYQFIGEISYPKQNRLLNSINGQGRRLTAAALTLLGVTMISLAAYWVVTANSDERVLVRLSNKLAPPATFILLETGNQPSAAGRAGLLGSLYQVTEYHLEQLPERHITRIPQFSDSDAYNSMLNHFSQFGQAEYTIQPILRETGDVLAIELNVQDPVTRQPIEQFHLNVAASDQTAALSQFETRLLETLKRLQLIPVEQAPVLGENVAANQAVIASAATLAKTDPQLTDIEQAIIDAQKAIELDPHNTIAYALLWEEILLIMTSFPGQYDVDSLMDTLKLKTEQAIQINPHYHKNLHANAEYYCWLQNESECTTRLTRALETKPYYARALYSLSQRLQRYSSSPLSVDRFRYEMNPFETGVLQYYRNTLIDNNRFSDLIEVLNKHTQWNTEPKDWYLEAQTQTTLEKLQAFTDWYRKHYQLSRSNPSKTENLPSRYIAYMLLNAGQPQLARYWGEQGRDKQLPYFELKVVDLLSDIWEGRWQSDRWRTVSDFAEDRLQFQTSLDKIYLAYLNFYAGLYNQSEQYLLKVFPYFASGQFEINHDNFRYAVYYAEIAKHQLDYKQAKLVNQALKEYLIRTGNQQNRNAYFGVADAEFYALNGDREKALKILETAVVEQHWLPNAFWLWPPLDSNPFLKNLDKEPKFKELNALVSRQLSQLCFAEPCE